MAAINSEFPDGGIRPGENVPAMGGALAGESDLADYAPPGDFVAGAGDGLFVEVDGTQSEDVIAVEDLRHGGKPGQE